MSQKFNARLVDQLGQVLAAKANLAKQEEAIKAQLVAEGVGAYEGLLFRATVSTSTRKLLDMDSVREKLSPQFIRANTREVESTVVRVVARTNEDLKVAA